MAVTGSNRVFVYNSHPRGKPFIRPLASMGRRTLARLGLIHHELSIALVGDRAIRRLNREWRKKDQSTDVLSFSVGDVPAVPGGARILGDVVISLDTARRRAPQGEVQSELSRYLVHGLLHLLGYDHQRETDARLMSQREAQLLGEGRGLLPSPRGRRKAEPSPDLHDGDPCQESSA